MAIPRETVDRIFEAAKIEEVVSDYVSLRRRGANLIGLCPFHSERTPSFNVNPARNICKCFGCGKGGSAINFIMEIEQCSYPEALRIVAKKYHIEIEERELTEEQKQAEDRRESMFAVNEWANQWFQKELWEGEEGQAVGYAYFRERGLTDETIRKFGLGYCPAKGNPMSLAAKQQGFSEQYLTNDPDTRIGTGICGRSSGENGRPSRLYDRYHDRVIFPIYGISGKTVGFAGRVLVKKDNVGKYVNSPDSLIYSKTRELYGLFQAKHAIVRQKKCYLVEGQMDCISMSQAGIENVVCSGGTALTKEQINRIHRFTENVTILYDGDAAGIHAALRGIDMFLEQGLNVKVMLFPDGDDPDSFARKHTDEEFVAYINSHEEDFITYKARTLIADAQGDIHKRAEAIHSIVHSIALISDKILQGEYVKECARVLERDIPSLTKAVNKERYNIYHPDQQKTGNNEQIGNGSTDTPIAAQPQEEAGKQTNFDMLDENSRNLLQMLVRYGERPMYFQGADGNTFQILIGDYIQQYLTQANITLKNPLYQLFFDEFNMHKAEPDFKAENCFIRNSNQYVVKLAVDLLAEKYTLSRIYTKDHENDADEYSPIQLQNIVCRLLYELHYTVIEEALNDLDRQMKEAETTGNEQLFGTLFARQPQYIQMKTYIGQLLGKN